MMRFQYRDLLLVVALSCSLPTVILAEENTPGRAGEGLQVGKAIPRARETSSNITRGLLYCLAVGLIGHGIVRRYRRGLPGIEKSNVPMQIVSKLQVGARQQVLLLEVDGERFILAQTTERLDCLARLGEAPDAPSAAVPPAPAIVSLRVGGMSG